jgi:ABC-type transport system substrate-binding protein
MATEAAQAPAEADRGAAAGTLHVVDPSPLNWLFITWNTMEEPIRVDEDGHVVHALAEDHRQVDERTLEMKVRQGVRFQDGEPLTAHDVKRNFDEMQRWAAPHPPGTWLNFPPETVCECPDDYTIRWTFPEPDGIAVGKMRGFHIGSHRFWGEIGFGYRKLASGEGHW